MGTLVRQFFPSKSEFKRKVVESIRTLSLEMAEGAIPKLEREVENVIGMLTGSLWSTENNYPNLVSAKDKLADALWKYKRNTTRAEFVKSGALDKELLRTREERKIWYKRPDDLDTCVEDTHNKDTVLEDFPTFSEAEANPDRINSRWLSIICVTLDLTVDAVLQKAGFDPKYVRSDSSNGLDSILSIVCELDEKD